VVTAIKWDDQRLSTALEASGKALEHARNTRRLFRGVYATHYYDQRESTRRPLNKVAQYVNTLLPHLLYSHKIMPIISTYNEWLQPEALATEHACGQLYEQIGLVRTLRMAIFDAFFGASIVKVGLSPGNVKEFAPDRRHDVGMPYCDLVDLDDYVVDPLARNREEARFEGNCFTLPLDYVCDCGLYDADTAIKVAKEQALLRPRADGKDRPSWRMDEIYESIYLCELWIPGERRILTIPGNHHSRGIMREVEWDGPELGPFHLLGFYEQPGSVLPVPPLAFVFDETEMANEIGRKLVNQARNSKEIVLFGATVDDQEAKAVLDASDGAVLPTRNPSEWANVKVGGFSPELFNVLAQLGNDINAVGGSPDLLGGIAPASKTATQDQMLMGAASVRVEDMRRQVSRFARGVASDLAWYVWTEPGVHKRYCVPFGGEQIAVTFSTDHQEGRWDEYRFDIDLYSVPPTSPEAMLRAYDEFIASMLPLMEAGAAQGVMLNVPEIAALKAKLRGLPNGQNLFIHAAPTPIEAQSQGMQGPEPAAVGSGRPSPMPAEEFMEAV